MAIALNLHFFWQKKGSTVETADLNDCLPYEKVRKSSLVKQEYWINYPFPCLFHKNRIANKFSRSIFITFYDFKPIAVELKALLPLHPGKSTRWWPTSFTAVKIIKSGNLYMLSSESLEVKAGVMIHMLAFNFLSQMIECETLHQ